MEIHSYIEYSLEDYIEKNTVSQTVFFFLLLPEEIGNSGYFWERERRQDRGVFKVDSSCSVVF